MKKNKLTGTMNSALTSIKLLLIICSFLLIASCEVDDLLGVNKTVAAIEGDWSCDETSEIYKSTNSGPALFSVYNVTISADHDNMNGVIIDNFYEVGLSIKANVSGNTITIPNQNAQDNYSVYGSGTISNNNNKITWAYVVNDGSGGPADNVTAIYTKL